MPKDFSRSRKLLFTDVFILILRNSIKSLQLMLNEFVLYTKKRYSITASAFTQARKKLKHTAFIELNEDLVSLYYKENEFKRLWGFRLLGVDGSKVTLPYNEELKREWGSKAVGNHTHKEFRDYSRATFEACYDVLNHIAVKSVLSRGDSYEVDLVGEVLDGIQPDDLLIFDRGYAAYEFLANLHKKKINYLIRCPKISFTAVQAMFEENSPMTVLAKLEVPTKHAKRLKRLELSTEINVRLVKVILTSGEVEVLVTSLIDEEMFKTEDFKQLYFLRWRVETFFSRLKSRLCLENFTGKSIEAIKQDFWSTIFMSNLETILTEDVEEELNDNLANGQLNKAINKAVSFNAIKNLAFEILSTEKNKDEILLKLSQLFLMNTGVIRENRKVPRYKISDTQSLNFQKRIKKHVF